MIMQLTVNETTAAHLEQVARDKDTTTQKLAEQAIREFLRAEARHRMQREMQAFVEMHSELLKQYPGEFVAIHQGRLIDHDRSQLALYLRIEKRSSYTPVLIKQVLDDPQEVYTFRSPTLVDSP